MECCCLAGANRHLQIPITGGQCNEPMGISSGTLPCNGCNTGFHIFRLEWDESKSPAELRWYQDGRQVFSVKSDQVKNRLRFLMLAYIFGIQFFVNIWRMFWAIDPILNP